VLAGIKRNGLDPFAEGVPMSGAWPVSETRKLYDWCTIPDKQWGPSPAVGRPAGRPKEIMKRR